MKIFDLVGALVVAGWVTLVGAYVYDTYIEDDAVEFGTGVVIREGEAWMLLTREEKEVGFLHETRTRLDTDGGWLLEYDLLMNVQLLNISQLLKVKTKATVDKSAYLSNFNATIAAGGTEFAVKGTVEGTRIVMTADIGGEPKKTTIEYGQRPRMVNSAINELVATPNLEAGQRFEREYFDPTAMGMTKVTYEYVREHDVTVYEQTFRTYHFRQLVAGTELDVYVDKDGETYIQEFPFRIIAARVPPEFGAARAQAMRRDYKTKGEKGVDLSVESAVAMMKAGNFAPTPVYRISNIAPEVELDLDSGQQKLTRRDEAVAVVDTSARGVRETLADADKPALLAASLRVDSDAKVFEELVAAIPATKVSVTSRAEELARVIAGKIEAKPEIGMATASQVIEAGKGDCTEYSLAYVAALRRAEIPARFVFGVKPDEQGLLKPHQWVQYWNGGEFIDVDPSDTTLLPVSGQLQLLTAPTPEHPDYVHVLDQLKIEAVQPESAPSASDFN